MQQKNISLFALILLGLGLTALHGQEVILTTGSNASGSGGSVSYSVGQIVYTSNTGSNGSVAQGVQQAFEISVVTGLDEVNGISLSVSAYPNPTTDYLILKVDASTLNSTQSFSFQLFDFNGKLLEYKKLEDNLVNINVCNLVPETYFLKVLESNKVVKTFKIIKD